jgi:protein-S-isoprenylcysteine O-methyltransferase Ste14
MNGLLARAVLAFLVLPGTVAFLIPWLLVEPGQSGQFVDARGLVPFVLGIVLLLWCVREFYVAGRGTLAPWSPPRHLVASGLYRFSRNPMYIAVVLVLWGWVLGFRSRAMAVYALLVMLVFHLRVILGEEPWLARAHGEEWIRYKAQVPRWFGFHRQNDSRMLANIQMEPRQTVCAIMSPRRAAHLARWRRLHGSSLLCRTGRPGPVSASTRFSWLHSSGRRFSIRCGACTSSGR